VADSGGARENRVRWRRGDVVARASARKETRASEGVRPVGLTEPPSRVRPGRLAPTGGLARQVGQGWQIKGEKERER
jgi:hypothetical protein